MKRHMVMDLYHGNENIPIGEWNQFIKNKPEDHAKVWVKLSDDRELFAYFYDDMPHGHYLWDCVTKQPLENVIEWKHLKENGQ